MSAQIDKPITRLLKFIYYLNIALLPGLAVIGYAVANLQGTIPDDIVGLMGFEYIVMAFMSVIAILSVNASKYPKSDFMAVITIIDTPVALLMMYYWGLEINFWAGCVMAFIVEMNALLLSSTVFTILYPKLGFIRTQYEEKFAEGGDGKVLYGFLLVNGILLNFTMYGEYFWKQVFEQTWWQVIPLVYAFLETTYFFFNSFRQRDTVAQGGEAVAVLGPEFVSGVILVPTWGMGLIGYPLLFLFVYAPAKEQKKQQEILINKQKEEQETKEKALSTAIDYSYYSIAVENSAPQYLPEAPQSNGDSCRSTLLAIQAEDLQVLDFQLAALRFELREEQYNSENNPSTIYPEIILTLANYRDRPYNKPHLDKDVSVRLVLRGIASKVLGVGKYTFGAKPQEYGKALSASIQLRGAKKSYPFYAATGFVEVTYLSQEYLCAYLDIKSSDEKDSVKGYLTLQIKRKE